MELNNFSNANVETKKETKIKEPEVTKTKELNKNGVVINCGLLNVRNKPSTDSKILFTIPVSSEVLIDHEKSTTDFYKIFTEIGLEGFVKKEYIKV